MITTVPMKIVIVASLALSMPFTPAGCRLDTGGTARMAVSRSDRMIRHACSTEMKALFSCHAEGAASCACGTQPFWLGHPEAGTCFKQPAPNKTSRGSAAPVGKQPAPPALRHCPFFMGSRLVELFEFVGQEADASLHSLWRK